MRFKKLFPLLVTLAGAGRRKLFVKMSFLSRSLPTEEVNRIQKLLNYDGTRAYFYFGVLILLVFIAACFVYYFVSSFLRILSNRWFRIKNVTVVNNLFFITLGFSILTHDLMGGWLIIFNPAMVLGVLCMATFLWKKQSRLTLNDLSYLACLYMFLVLMNIVLWIVF
ncbi:hypothetical protein TP70_00620 [Staphylococcus microti]|nr:hypothetical protein TP70_00620 [Staphylococcus microti]PNZ84416.1 hypothetical protein CD132_00280 [Staphylococcus microti]